MSRDDFAVRVATADDAVETGRFLHDFNTEFDTPTPGPAVLASRLSVLLGSNDTFAILAGDPPIAVALVTLRSNVWYDGRVALLDELYVTPNLRGRGIGSSIMAKLLTLCQSVGVDEIEINVDEEDIDAQRFYVRHGYSSTQSDSGARAIYFFRALSNSSES